MKFQAYSQRYGHDINGIRPVMIPDEHGGWVSRHGDADNALTMLSLAVASLMVRLDVTVVEISLDGCVIAHEIKRCSE